MSDFKTSELMPASALDGTEVVAVVQTGSNRRSTAQDIADLATGGAGTPGGSDTQFQYNNAGGFGGTVGVTYAGPGQVVIDIGTITTSKQALKITGTFAAPSPVKFSPVIFDFATSGSVDLESKLIELKCDSVSKFAVFRDGSVTFGGGATFNGQVIAPVAGTVVAAAFEKPGFGLCQEDSTSTVSVATFIGQGAIAADTGWIGTITNHPFAFFANNSFEILSMNDTGIVAFGAVGDATVPALKPSGTTLQARLGDNSDFSDIQGKLTTETNYTATPIVPTGYLTLYDATGTAYKVPCVAA